MGKKKLQAVLKIFCRLLNTIFNWLPIIYLILLEQVYTYAENGLGWGRGLGLLGDYKQNTYHTQSTINKNNFKEATNARDSRWMNEWCDIDYLKFMDN